MHLTRPKSSKGRSRPAVSMDYSTQRPPPSPDPPVLNSRPDRNLRSQSQPAMCQSGQMSQDQVFQMLHLTPTTAPPLSLNRYTVLPSIEKRPADVRNLDRHMSELHLCDDQSNEGPHPPNTSEKDPQTWPKHPPDPGLETAKSDGSFGGFLLAIRAPCGRRFEQHFDPLDTLLAVKSSAEVRYGVQYRGVSIETMDVPRRTFTDMGMSLAQCGIVNKSVLCISQNDSEAERV
ncbi:UBX domain-containing protein 10 [Xyrichtys novacula]|uniref:UBX domain-containing protein 10 n=1 Tax=Xyrichtys novacula TaxID=13765 RepID=A0AAV1HGL0_XYRNO|nr:UBX domain-containing protein 10 [Xyrichtys novacula]